MAVAHRSYRKGFLLILDGMLVLMVCFYGIENIELLLGGPIKMYSVDIIIFLRKCLLTSEKLFQQYLFTSKNINRFWIKLFYDWLDFIFAL